MRTIGRVAVAAAVLAAGLSAPVALGSPDEPLIVGGESSNTAEYPWVVALTTSTSESAYCGGALAAYDRVVTAAHCISGYSLASVRVIVGRTDLRTDEGEERGVLRAWVHPDYQSPTQGADVAVLFLDRAVPYRPVPLETSQDAYYPGRPATVLGWGYTSEGGPSSSELRRAEVALVADSDCAATFREFNPQSMVCAAASDGRTDACYGDSGGPMVADGRLIGIISWGSGCAREGTPGVYVRVASYAAAISAQLAEPDQSSEGTG